MTVSVTMSVENKGGIDCGSKAYWAMIDKFTQFLIIDNDFVEMPDFAEHNIIHKIKDLTCKSYWCNTLQGQLSCIHHTRNLQGSQDMVSKWAKETGAYKKEEFVERYLNLCVLTMIARDIHDALDKLLTKEN